jgi:putative oxidoreductase
MLRNLLKTNNDVALTVLRLILGLVFLAHGSQKVLGLFGGLGYSGTMQAMTSMGMPKALVLFIMAAEFVGGLLLLLGIFTRLGALAIIALMSGAILMVHRQFGFFMNWFGNQKGEGFEYHLLAIAIAIALLIRGGGAFSVDHTLTEPRTGMRRAA